MKRCPIAIKIAGSIGILPCCVLNELFTLGYERHRTDFEADRWPETWHFILPKLKLSEYTV